MDNIASSWGNYIYRPEIFWKVPEKNLNSDWNHPNKLAVAALEVYHPELPSVESLPLQVQVVESLQLQNFRIQPSIQANANIGLGRL